MKNTNKKGFTLVELVIVIAVIAILAGVMIGTFAGVISRANQSAAVQELKAAIDAEYVEYVAEYKTVPTSLYLKDGAFTFIEPETGTYTTYKLYKAAEDPNPAVTKTYVVLDSANSVYLVWDAENGYQVKALKTDPAGYTDSTTL